MRISYTRVSKADGSQSLDLQHDALLAAGIDDPDKKKGACCDPKKNATLYRQNQDRRKMHQRRRR